MYTITSVLQILSSEHYFLSDHGQAISELVYDSRKVRNVKEGLFFAIKSSRDGHQFIPDAYEKGIRSFVVSDENFSISPYPDANFIWVEDALKAIQALAEFHRKMFTIPVIGITGSNGKTIVKEWLYQLLSVEHNVYRSPKSYNSQLGVALSVWNLQADHTIAIIEAGISRAGEMEALQKMINPSIGILTNLGIAHMEGFSSKAEKLEEKWKLFKNAKHVLFSSHYVAEVESIQNRFTWGTRESDDLHILNLSSLHAESKVTARYREKDFEFIIPFQDKASIENVITCIIVMIRLGYDFSVIQNRIKGLKRLEMRLQLKKGKNNCSIIDDTYSNDLASLQIALDFLNQQNQYSEKSLILSGFVDVKSTQEMMDKLTHLLNNQMLKRVILIDPSLFSVAAEIHSEVLCYTSTAELLADLPRIHFSNETILIKGARKFRLEEVSQQLVEKSHDTVLEINLKAIENNLIHYRSLLRKDVKLMAMVKAFSYGSGSFEVANILQFNKLDYLTVAFVDEGVELRKAGVTLPIMVLSPHEGTFDDILSYGLEPEIYSMRILNAFIKFLVDRQIKDYPIHIKLDTGMHRLGFTANELEDAFAVLDNSLQIKVVSVFSHLAASADIALKEFTTRQIEEFKTLAFRLESVLGYTVLKHICNTAGIVNWPEAQMDMVRLGIGLYGIDLSDNALHLEPVNVLKTTISQIKKLNKEETVGYDRKGVLKRDSRIATVKIGYADGYDRRFGNGVGKMMIAGQIIPVIGNICMDMCMLDITDITANEGDEVVVFPDLLQAAKDIGTIPYELLVGISSRVKRIYFYE
ncbi:bifunctional UDP-N-acetylmuramoyl-tripeptide:D-alanyl-D-alanine ligase/alanine racemase [Sphingobacterium alkalisoli]|uniref:Alanine racemase n=1 Tax=Sphingobacterium alkalisoli TaxID=1874115 RepID=A0A4U0GXI2_9SPHI|nr:bifunctional UDP-N-acetylmuramoyl-tripeptide:D-alanyl-D-alanine ligase/alanine racemase [Sphingobacterium alkalisoli]TJY63843.1 bifunctional UDP-N-acetylmuramoyl-tripeptide:D-alanyl-D-alanine ligase/alanine racemase [Sphingobacterium alkalisoli]GGH24517.1 bifunctional UDP-N-acetylmuramoyl-tripeptide:D-alanyl-D-alanine ligase/alanine racemase [Sphingobacterium alkalisoli]